MNSVNPATMTAFARRLVRPSLFWQIAFLCSAMIFVTIGVTWWWSDALAVRYGAVLGERYGVDMDIAYRMFIDSLHRSLIVAAAVGIVASLMAGAVFVPRILAPFRLMARQADEVASGNFDVRVDVARVSRRCEVHALGSAFNRMAARLQHVDSARKRMVSDLAHDLLTPLTNLRGYVEALREGVVSGVPTVFAMLEGEIGRLIRLVGDLHQLTLAEVARHGLNLAVIDTETVLVQTVHGLDHDAAARDITITHAVDAGAATLVADSDLLIRALQNIVRNATRFARPGSIVRLSAGLRAGKIEISCTDEGPGISDADLPFIFDRFYRADSARSREGGAGLGLAIARELVEAQGGTIAARTSAGETVITIALPLPKPA